MYEEFFGLREKPFALTPNPRFVFQSEQYRTAEEALLYGVAQKEGFMLVTGAPGTGKTTLCRDLLEKLDGDRHRVALLFNPFLNGVEMLQAVLSEFGLPEAAATSSRKELLDRLNAFLLEQLAQGRTCIAIFDEAQHLSTEFLEQIRVLSNLETNSEKLIQIILVGQPELLDLVRTPQMAQLDQRVSVRCTLTHLSREETGRYIYHRLNVAGAQGRVRFQEVSVRAIHGATGGVPRLINLTCDRSLLAGYTAGARSIGEPHVRQALASLRGEEGIDENAARAARTLSRAPRRKPWMILAAAATIALAAVGLWQIDASAEVLALRAAMTGSPQESERVYSRIAREHRQSRQREGAVLRLAQIHIARGEAREAMAWLDLLYREYPEGGADPARQFWTARALVAGGDTVRACRIVRSIAGQPQAGDLRGITRDCDSFDARVAADSVVKDSAAVVPAGRPASSGTMR